MSSCLHDFAAATLDEADDGVLYVHGASRPSAVLPATSMMTSPPTATERGDDRTFPTGQTTKGTP